MCLYRVFFTVLYTSYMLVFIMAKVYPHFFVAILYIINHGLSPLLEGYQVLENRN